MRKCFVVLCLGLASPWLWAEKEKRGEITISYIEGEVEVIISPKKSWERAKLFTKLKEGDRIRTKLQSKAELKLSDGSTINLSENSIMDINELLEKGLTKKSSFKLWIGGIKARFERLRTKDSEAKFYTPTAVMGLRGTTFWLLVDWEGRTRCGFEEGDGYIYSDKEGEKAVKEKEEASVSLEGEITIKSLGLRTVPHVMGKSLNEAKMDITGAGLNVGEIRIKESREPKDTVLSQYPAGGSEVLANTSVDLVVASEIPPCIIPDLIGLSKEEAIAKITEAGLILGIIIEQTSERPKGEVLKQRPNPGTEVKKESLVDLMVSKGLPPKVKPPIPKIHSQFSIPGLFVKEIPSLILNITPADKKLAPLFLSVMGRLTRFNNPPYLLNFKIPVMSIGINKIDVSAWFEGGDKAEEIITTPYYDPLPPKIVSVKVVKGKVRVVVEDRESGIKEVKIEGETPSLVDYTQEERGGRNVYVRGIYEKALSSEGFTRPYLSVTIEASDNAGNKRERRERIPDIPPLPKE